jgi:hypothetical protein
MTFCPETSLPVSSPSRLIQEYKKQKKESGFVWFSLKLLSFSEHQDN